MRNLPGLLAALSLVVGMFPRVVPAAPSNVAYVSNQGGGVTVIDLDTMQPIRQVAVGGRGPRGIGITPDGKYLLTANQHTADVSVIDTSDFKVVKRIHIGKNPEFMRVLPQGDQAVVTYEPSSTGGPPSKRKEHEEEEKGTPAEVAVIDLKNGTVASHVTGGLETEGIEFSPHDHYMAVANEGNDTLGVYDLTSWKLIRTVDLHGYGHRPRGIKISPDGQHYVVTMENSNNFLVLDRDFKVLKSVPTATGPYGVTFDADGKRIFISAARAKLLQVFDAQSYAPLAKVAVGKRCWHFSFTPQGTQLLAACGRSNNVYVIDTQTYKTTKVIPGFKLPWGIVTFPKSYGSLDAP